MYPADLAQLHVEAGISSSVFDWLVRANRGKVHSLLRVAGDVTLVLFRSMLPAKMTHASAFPSQKNFCGSIFTPQTPISRYNIRRGSAKPNH